MIRWDPPPDVAAVVDHWDAAQDVVAAVHALEGELSRVFGSLEQRVRLADPRWWERRQGVVRVLPVPQVSFHLDGWRDPWGNPFLEIGVSEYGPGALLGAEARGTRAWVWVGLRSRQPALTALRDDLRRRFDGQGTIGGAGGYVVSRWLRLESDRALGEGLERMLDQIVGLWRGWADTADEAADSVATARLELGRE